MANTLLSTAGLTLCLIGYQPSFAATINIPQAEPVKPSTARGVIRASQTADIAAAMTGQLLQAPYKSGEYFKAGALLAKFDCISQEAELVALQKNYQTHNVKYDTASELFNYGAAGKLDVTLARSEMQHALANIDVMKAQLRHCTVYAPFSGYITKRHVSAFETLQAGQALYSIQRAGSFELSIIAPSKWMKWLEKGQLLEFKVDETGEVFDASVSRIGRSVDPVSQTLEIIAKPKRNPKALPGMSGVARLKARS